MSKCLNPEQLQMYYRHGFCSPIDIMSEDMAIELRQRFEALEFKYPNALNSHNRNNSHLTFTVIDEIVHNPVILDAVSDIIGPDIMVWGSVLFIKEPHDPGFVSWHQDARYAGLEPHEGITAWFALSPSTPESGCMQMLPGSHQTGIHEHTDTFNEDNILTRGQKVKIEDETGSIDLILRPGQMSLHHPRVIHSSRANKSGTRRIGIVIQKFVPPHVQPTQGDKLFQWARGADIPSCCTEIPRPSRDMDPKGIQWQKRANANWTLIHYDRAEQTRDY